MSITRSKLYIVHNIGGTWAAVDIAAGIAGTITAVQNAIPTNVSQLDGIDAYEPLAELDKDYSGEVSINELESNVVYYIYACISLKISNYNYAYNVSSLALPPTFIFVEPSSNLTIDITPTYKLRVGDSLRLEAGKTYRMSIMIRTPLEWKFTENLP